MTRTSVAAALLCSFAPLFPASAIAQDVAQKGPAAEQVAESPRPPVPLVLLRRSAKKAPHGSDDVLVRANQVTDDIARRADRIMSAPGGYGQFVLRLNQFAKTSLLREAGVAPDAQAALREPAYLFLSDRQGGFPSEGFWLEQEDGTLREMRGVPFVDTVVDARDLEPGTVDGIEAIYAHELGHLVMTALAGPMPRRASSAMHFVTVRTDGWLAFSEGWGEHFQPAAMDHRGIVRATARSGVAPLDSARAWRARFEREQANGCWICPANLRFPWWHGRGEQSLRDTGVRANLFVHEVALPPTLRGDGRPSSEVRMYRDVVAPGLDGPLKNGAAMMASEGVIATLFYRLASDARLRAAYREPSFYEPYLDAFEAGVLRQRGPAAVISPAQNVYLKLFDVLRHRFSWGDWPAVELVKGYAARFPDEAAAIYDAFLDVTRGVTVEHAAFARQAEAGYLPDLRDRLMTGAEAIDGNLGRPLWMAVSGVQLGLGIYRYIPVPSSLSLDLNAADVADLRAVPGVSLSLAQAVVRAREQRGSFQSVDDLAAVPGMTHEEFLQIKEMHERMQAQLAKAEPRGADPWWLKNYVVALVKGSYYLPTAWNMTLVGLAIGATWTAVLHRHPHPGLAAFFTTAASAIAAAAVVGAMY